MAEPLGAKPSLALTGALTAAPEVPLQATFNAWMQAEQRRVFSLCYHMLQDRDEADSATQDVFLKAHRALQRGTAAPNEPARWLTRIAVNTCLDRLRSQRWRFWRRRTPASDAREAMDTAVCPDPRADDHYFAVQIRFRLAAALGRLSERQRIVFSLRHYQNLSMDEIAATLDLDNGTVKAHLHRAVIKLRVELRDLYGGKR